MTSEELNKIKQLFATDDLANHILGTLLYLNPSEGRNYRTLFWLIINDRNGWYEDTIPLYQQIHISFSKIILDTYLEFNLFFSGGVQFEGIINFFVGEDLIDGTEEDFWNELTEEFTNRIEEIFNDNDSTSSI